MIVVKPTRIIACDLTFSFFACNNMCISLALPFYMAHTYNGIIKEQKYHTMQLFFFLHMLFNNRLLTLHTCLPPKIAERRRRTKKDRKLT